MKNRILFAILLLSVQFAFAKKVKFSVNMTGQAVHASGVHVMGDFQQLAGLGADYSPDSALMTQDAVDTNIYYLYCDIPAFAKYQYKYVNGDGAYGLELVPEKAQVGYNGDDNRWIYIDSLANDTTLLPTVVFNYNSPAGLTMMRYIVDMTLQTVSPNGVHIAGDFQGWNPATSRLYSFGNNAYEIIVYGTLGNTYQYQFYNGNAVVDSEMVPAPCGVNSNRSMQLDMDTILSKVCFGTCTTCYPAAVADQNEREDIKIFPNPMSTFLNIELNPSFQNYEVNISDLSGRTILTMSGIQEQKIRMENKSLASGIYLVSIIDKSGQKITRKLSVE
ncbi:MAG: T9SS type A sorting domain-containing protein [Bacteroidetes bacterium]|nr:T9SS type A sorting domain-containing protein [Bacteroidota bacterium]MBP6314798.1 T9SS type A sorting domain-containing protein [Chitinophagaceae bacterium]